MSGYVCEHWWMVVKLLEAGVVSALVCMVKQRSAESVSPGAFSLIVSRNILYTMKHTSFEKFRPNSKAATVKINLFALQFWPFPTAGTTTVPNSNLALDQFVPSGEIV